MQLQVSAEINEVLEKAVALSINCGHFFVGAEHLFAALLEHSDGLPQAVCDKYLNSFHSVVRELNRTAWTEVIRSEGGEVFYTPRGIALTNSAAKLAERISRSSANPGHLLLAILTDGYSGPSRAMDHLGQGRGECIKLLQHSLSGVSGQDKPGAVAQQGAGPGAGAAAAGVAVAGAGADVASGNQGDGPPAPALTRNLTEAARRGELEAAVGRDDEMFEILQVLTRKGKNNVVLIGEAGVGKTHVVEGLALKLAKENGANGSPNFIIEELNLAALMTGTQYRGAFEEKILGLIEKLKQSPNIVLFIDELHLIMGAGATDGDSMDFANLLKPVLARGEISVIGATTLQEYRKFVEKDPAIERRFQMVRLEELSEDATFEVLKRLRKSFERHHQVKIGDATLKAAISLTQRYMPNGNFPDKAIDVIDQACARHRLKLMALNTNPEMLEGTMIAAGDNKVTPHSIRKIISQVTAIPIEEMTAEDRMMLNDLDRRLKKQLIGQDEAVMKAVAAVKKSRAGLSDPNRPDAVMLFLGVSGVGKTELAKLLAQHIFGSANHLLQFDMSEYIEEHSVSRLLGAPPGYVGSDEEGRLTGAVKDMPFSIVLFDEIEKAHPRIYDIFLPIFEEGRLKDSRGKEVSFKNSIIILTSNIGADVLRNSGSGEVGEDLMEALRGHFRPELINRIDEIVPFYPLLWEDLRSILRLEVNAVRGRLKAKRMGIRMYQRAYEYLAKEGYSEEFGARGLRRVVDKLITTPISDMLLKGEFVEGDMIDVLAEEDGLVFRKGKPPSGEKNEAEP